MNNDPFQSDLKPRRLTPEEYYNLNPIETPQTTRITPEEYYKLNPMTPTPETDPGLISSFVGGAKAAFRDSARGYTEGLPLQWKAQFDWGTPEYAESRKVYLEELTRIQRENPGVNIDWENPVSWNNLQFVFQTLGQTAANFLPALAAGAAAGAMIGGPVGMVAGGLVSGAMGLGQVATEIANYQAASENKMDPAVALGAMTIIVALDTYLPVKLVKSLGINPASLAKDITGRILADPNRAMRAAKLAGIASLTEGSLEGAQQVFSEAARASLGDLGISNEQLVKNIAESVIGGIIGGGVMGGGRGLLSGTPGAEVENITPPPGTPRPEAGVTPPRQNPPGETATTPLYTNESEQPSILDEFGAEPESQEDLDLEAQVYGQPPIPPVNLNDLQAEVQREMGAFVSPQPGIPPNAPAPIITPDVAPVPPVGGAIGSVSAVAPGAPIGTPPVTPSIPLTEPPINVNPETGEILPAKAPVQEATRYAWLVDDFTGQRQKVALVGDGMFRPLGVEKMARLPQGQERLEPIEGVPEGTVNPITGYFKPHTPEGMIDSTTGKEFTAEDLEDNVADIPFGEVEEISAAPEFKPNAWLVNTETGERKGILSFDGREYKDAVYGPTLRRRRNEVIEVIPAPEVPITTNGEPVPTGAEEVNKFVQPVSTPVAIEPEGKKVPVEGPVIVETTGGDLKPVEGQVPREPIATKEELDKLENLDSLREQLLDKYKKKFGASVWGENDPYAKPETFRRPLAKLEKDLATLRGDLMGVEDPSVIKKFLSEEWDSKELYKKIHALGLQQNKEFQAALGLEEAQAEPLRIGKVTVGLNADSALATGDGIMPYRKGMSTEEFVTQIGETMDAQEKKLGVKDLHMEIVEPFQIQMTPEEKAALKADEMAQTDFEQIVQRVEKFLREKGTLGEEEIISREVENKDLKQQLEQELLEVRLARPKEERITAPRGKNRTESAMALYKEKKTLAERRFNKEVAAWHKKVTGLEKAVEIASSATSKIDTKVATFNYNNRVYTVTYVPQATGGKERGGVAWKIHVGEKAGDYARRDVQVWRQRNGLKSPLGMDVSIAQEVISNIEQVYPNAPKVRLIRLRNIADEKLRGEMANSKGFWMPGENVSYIILDNHEGVVDIAKTWFHEVVGHQGVYAILPASMREKFFSLVPGEDRIAKEEYVARIAEDRSEPKLLDRVVALVREAIRTVFPKLSVSDGEIRLMLRRVKSAYRAEPSAAAKKAFEGDVFGLDNGLLANTYRHLRIQPVDADAIVAGQNAWNDAQKLQQFANVKHGARKALFKSLTAHQFREQYGGKLENLAKNGIYLPNVNNFFKYLGDFVSKGRMAIVAEGSRVLRQHLIGGILRNKVNTEKVSEGILYIDQEIGKMRGRPWINVQEYLTIHKPELLPYAEHIQAFFDANRDFFYKAGAADFSQKYKNEIGVGGEIGNRFGQELSEALATARTERALGGGVYLARLTKTEVSRIVQQVVNRQGADPAIQGTSMAQALDPNNPNGRYFILVRDLTEMARKAELIGGTNYFPHMGHGQYFIRAVSLRDGLAVTPPNGMGYIADEGRSVGFWRHDKFKDRPMNEAVIRQTLFEDFGLREGQDYKLQKGVIPRKYMPYVGLTADYAREVIAKLKRDGRFTPQQELVAKDIIMSTAIGRFPQGNFYARLLKRKGIEGFSKDIVRSFTSYTNSISGYVARRLYNDEMMNEIQQLRELGRHGDMVDNTLINEVADHLHKWYDYISEPRREFEKLKAFAFHYWFAGNIKAVTVNLVQNPIVTTAYLGSKYGYIKGWNEILNTGLRLTTQIVTGQMPLSKKNYGKVAGGLVSGADAQILETLLNRAADDNIIDQGQIYEMGAYSGVDAVSMREGLSGGKYGIKKAVKFLSTAGSLGQTASELLNRHWAFIATSLLEIKKQRAEFGTVNIDDVYDAAVDTVITTNVDYSKWAKAPIFRGHGAWLLTFQQYPQSLAYMLYGGKGAKTAMITWAHLLATAGIMGLPFSQDGEDIIEYLIRKAGEATGNKYLRINIEKEMRDLLKETGGEGFSELMMDGLGGSYGLGPLHLLSLLGVPLPEVNISGSIGMGKFSSGVEPITSPDMNPQNRVYRSVVGLAGVMGTLFDRIVTQGLLSNEPWDFRRVSKFLPVAVQNLEKYTSILSNSGEVDKAGRVIIPYELGKAKDQTAAALRGMGFMPNESDIAPGVLTRKERYEAVLARNFWNGRRQAVLDAYWESVKDPTLRPLAKKALIEFNQAIRPYAPAAQITEKTLQTSLENKAQNKARVEHGLPLQQDQMYAPLFKK